MELNQKPKVSVIMGIYNCSQTLGEALDSILAQTYSDWECIMCDDGSKDHTYDVAQEYVRNHPKKFILLQNTTNQGLNYTLNRCLKEARGEYVARMDGDDLSEPTRFEEEVQFLDQHPEFSVVSTEMVMFDDLGVFGKTHVIERPTVHDFLRHTPFFCHAACMIRRPVFLEVGGYTVDPKLLRVEDCHLWFKIYSSGYQGANIPKPLYKMRDDRNAISRRSFRARKNGIYVMYAGFRMLHMPWYEYRFVVWCAIREMLKCIIPTPVYKFMHRKKHQV